MVYITGDCHAEFNKFSTNAFPEQKEMTREDIVIICGDFGGVWNGGGSESYWMNWLSEKQFTIVFVDGNHENFDRLYSDEFEIVDYHGGKAHKIRENIYHLMRGYVFDFDGKKFFAFGGARSHDIGDGILDESDFNSREEMMREASKMRREYKLFRINHISWWEQELPTKEEMLFGLENLDKNGNEVDYIVSHCCPAQIAAMYGFHDTDILSQYFNTILEDVKFKKWFFGHYHDDKQIMVKFIMLYDQIVRVV